MKRFLAVFLALFFIACSGEKIPSAKAEAISKKSQAAQPAQTSEFKNVSQIKKGDIVFGKVMEMKDGDTFVVNSEQYRPFFLCRLYGVDAPEIPNKSGKHGQPYGKEAENALSHMILGKEIRIEIMPKDPYGRQVCLTTVDSASVNIEMLRLGLAWAEPKYLRKKYKQEYIGWENAAREQRLGLWQDKNPENPSDYRKRMKGRKKK